ncbi:MAG TPA: VWA domain-containing protein [Pyrinomonadaceae bacterium]|nr:VWA domain-containing protein [Pyrinomonadaceae bacterium]
MIKRPTLVFALVFVMLMNAFGQTQTQPQQRQPTPSPSPTPQPSPAQNPPEDDDEVVRITTNLVQVDAVVTDRNGKQITDLRAEDFMVLENARPQQITNFSYITAGGAETAATTPAPAPRATPARDRNAPVIPPARLRPTQVQRTLALVIDDLGMSADSIHDARRALRKYVDEQVQPTDMVAIIRTSAGVGALQQFTNDRRQLYAAIERVRWLPRGLGGQSALAQFDTVDSLAGAGATDDGTPDLLPESVDSQRAGLKELNEYRRELFTVGTLGALNFVVRGLREMPGRKAVILFSNGLPLMDSRGESTLYIGILRRLVDLANRASVVFYTIDARGLLPNGPTAADDTAGSPGGTGMAGGIATHQIGQRVLRMRSGAIFEGQSGLKYLARETGGISLINNNDLNLGVRRALDDMRGYYLIGYRPDESSFDASTVRLRFNSLKIVVKNRPDLTVRTRSGFLSVSEEAQPRTQPRTRAGQLMAALTSPFGSGGVNLRLTSLFINSPDGAPAIRSMLLIDPRTLSFTRQPDGQYQTVLDILAVTFGENGMPVDQLNRIETIRVRPESYEQFLSQGMIYDLHVPIKKPGAYQLRIAVRDKATERVGAASQYVEVPNLKRKRLALSGLVVAAAPIESALQTTNAAVSNKAAATNGDEQANPATRRFRTGMMLDYGLIVYNARPERATGRTQLTIQARLYREGREVFAGQAQPLNPGTQTTLARIETAGRLQLGSELPPGEYALQIIVTDALADKQHRTAAQWIDFELVK